MQLLVDILLIVVPVFLVIALGFGLKRTSLINDGFVSQLNRLVFYLALPSLLFYKISQADFQASLNLRLLLGVAGVVVVSFAGSYLYGVLRGYSPARLGAFCQGSSRGNLAFMGLAVAFNAYGEPGLATLGVLAGFIIPMINMLSVLALLLPQRRNQQSMTAAFWMYQFAFNPLIIASFAGILWSYFALPLPAVVARALDIVSSMALPLALIAIGASFSPKKLQGDLAVAGLATTIKLVCQPLAAALVLMALGIQGRELGVGVIIAGTPTAAAAYIMAQQMKSDAELSGTIIMLSTACSLATYTVALYLLAAFKL